MESSDEDDKFLYGSDDDQNNNKDIQTKLDSSENNINKRNIDNVDKDFNDTESFKDHNNKKIKLSKTDDNNSQSFTEIKQSKTKGFKDEGDNEKDSDNVNENNTDNINSNKREDEDDIIFIISLGPDTSRLDFRSVVNLTANASLPITSTTPNNTVPTSASGDTISVAVETNNLKNDKESLENEKLIQNEELKSNINNIGSIDLDQDGLYDGQPITQLDPEVLKEKPWRQPGANLSDYFNYGFNELTWVEYVHRQGNLRDTYNPRKILMGLMNLQQQGKMDIKTTLPTNDMIPQLNNKSAMLKQPMMQQSMMQPPPPGFPPLPMFGGFPPFPMPGMMPMNQLKPNTNNNNPNLNQLDNINNTKK